VADSKEYPRRGRHGHVVHELGGRIVRGELEPGEVLPPEEELVAGLGVGRAAVRDGVKVLTGKGLLAARPSAGTRVRPRELWNLLDPDVLSWRYAPDPSPEDVMALAGLRVALEPGAARLAAESATDDDIRKMEIALANMRATVRKPDQREFIDADLEFHQAVVAASGNDLLIYIYEMMTIALRAVRPVHTYDQEHNVDTVPSHERVLAAIRARHHRKAAEAMDTVVTVARKDAELEIQTPGETRRRHA